MELADIPRHDKEKTPYPEVKELREHAPEYLVSLIESGVLENINSLADIPSTALSVIEGGQASAAYVVSNNDKPVIIKFRHFGTDEEVATLQAMHRHGIHTPEIYASGGISEEQKVKYSVLEAIRTPEGNLAPTGHMFFKRHPEQRAALSYHMGQLLGKIHQAPLSDNLLQTIQYQQAEDIAQWVQSEITKPDTQEILQLCGVDKNVIKSLRDIVSTITFPTHPGLVHGDYGLHNVLVPTEDTHDIYIIDPNPRLTDPYVDLARQRNKLQVKHLRARQDPTKLSDADQEQLYYDNLLTGYIEQTGNRIDPQRLLIHQILLDSRRIQREVENPQPDTPLRKQVLRQNVEEILKPFGFAHGERVQDDGNK